MNNILHIALITFKECLRHRVIYGTFVAALFVISLSTVIGGMYMRDLLKIILDICLSAVSLGSLLIPFFFVISLFLNDLENKTAYFILAQRISRAEYLLGKYLGFAMLSVLVVGILTVASVIAVYSATFFFYEQLFENFSLSAILLSSTMGLLGILVLNSVVILWCTLTTSSFLVTLLTLATYIIGHTIEDVIYFISLQLEGVEFSPPLKNLIHFVQYIFPNLAAFDLKQLAAYGHAIPTQEALFLCIYGVAYTGIMLLLSTLSFKRLDLT